MSDNPAVPHIFSLQIIATPGDEEGELETALMLQVPEEEFDPLDYIAFLKTGAEQVTAMYHDQFDRAVETYAEVAGISERQAKIDLSDSLCDQVGLAVGTGGDEGDSSDSGLILAS